jgi:hypothetical protein
MFTADRMPELMKTEKVFDRNIYPLGGSRLWRRIPARALLLALACALAGTLGTAKDKAPVEYQIPLPPAPDFSAIDWLVGVWSGKTLPKSPPGDVRLTVTLDLEKHFLIFRGQVSLAATQSVAVTKESWMGILSADPQAAGFTLRVFSSTGFITHYRVTVDGPLVRLNPAGGDRPPPGWLFRRVLERTGPSEFTETVQAAPPAKSFFDYYVAKLTRVPPLEKARHAP